MVALIAPEAYTAEVRMWLREQAVGQSAVSEWVRTEAASALSIK